VEGNLRTKFGKKNAKKKKKIKGRKEGGKENRVRVKRTKEKRLHWMKPTFPQVRRTPQVDKQA